MTGRSSAADRPAPKRTDVADGIYLFQPPRTERSASTAIPWSSSPARASSSSTRTARRLLRQRCSRESSSAQKRLDDARFFLDQKRSVRHVFPDVTFTSQIDLHLGDRVVQVRHHDRAVTPGDAYLVLPKEKILVSGDLLVNPIPFGLSIYPTGWLKTLEALDALDASIIIPGHGDPLRDESLLHATMEVFRVLLREGRIAKGEGIEVDAAKDAILPALAAPIKTITRGDATLEGHFRIYVVDWFLHRVYDELNGPLTNAIAPMPKS